MADGGLHLAHPPRRPRAGRARPRGSWPCPGRGRSAPRRGRSCVGGEDHAALARQRPPWWDRTRTPRRRATRSRPSARRSWSRGRGRRPRSKRSRRCSAQGRRMAATPGADEPADVHVDAPPTTCGVSAAATVARSDRAMRRRVDVARSGAGRPHGRRPRRWRRRCWPARYTSPPSTPAARSRRSRGRWCPNWSPPCSRSPCRGRERGLEAALVSGAEGQVARRQGSRRSAPGCCRRASARNTTRAGGTSGPVTSEVPTGSGVSATCCGPAQHDRGRSPIDAIDGHGHERRPGHRRGGSASPNRPTPSRRSSPAARATVISGKETLRQPGLIGRLGQQHGGQSGHAQGVRDPRGQDGPPDRARSRGRRPW